MTARNLWEQPNDSEFSVNHEAVDEMLDQRVDFMKSKIRNLNETTLPKPVEFSCEYDPKKDATVYMMTAVNESINTLGIQDYHKRVMERMDPDLRNVVEDPQQTKDSLPGTIEKFLQDRYEANKEYVQKYLGYLREAFNQASPKIIRNLQTLYGKEFPFDQVDIYISTSSACPYDEIKGNFAVTAFGGFKKDFRNPVDIGLHEMNHFMWGHSEYPARLKERLTSKEIDLIKETLTYFTEPDDPSTRPAEKPLKALYAGQEWESLDQVVETAANFLISVRANGKTP